jgi:hypothetical protein
MVTRTEAFIGIDVAKLRNAVAVAEYDALMRTLISPERMALWDRCEADSWRPRLDKAYNWALTLAALKQERNNMQAV